jgi:hypothetical protein
MPRLARLDAPGVLHYVVGRGIERRKIFLSDIGEVADQRILGDGDFVKQVISGLDDLVKKNLRLSGQ